MPGKKEEKEIRKCIICGKSLRAIGINTRKNGKGHPDWETRTKHKKCWMNEK